MRMIDADALKDEIAVLFERNPNLIDEWLSYQVEDAIDDAPTIEERKKGKWERHILKNENVPWGYDCSTCGTWFVIGEDTANKYNYCPNCGSYNGGET